MSWPEAKNRMQPGISLGTKQKNPCTTISDLLPGSIAKQNPAATAAAAASLYLQAPDLLNKSKLAHTSQQQSEFRPHVGRWKCRCRSSKGRRTHSVPLSVLAKNNKHAPTHRQTDIFYITADWRSCSKKKGGIDPTDIFAVLEPQNPPIM